MRKPLYYATIVTDLKSRGVVTRFDAFRCVDYFSCDATVVQCSPLQAHHIVGVVGFFY
jgi:hypothetical protein